jgi:transcriptional regulator with XRE-family HTH domain
MKNVTKDREKFSSWLQSELKKREWSQADLARKSGVSTGQIARVMDNTRGVGPESLVQIARALSIPPVHVFEMAGILPTGSKNDADEWSSRMIGMLNEIGPEGREFAGLFIETLYETEMKRRRGGKRKA